MKILVPLLALLIVCSSWMGRAESKAVLPCPSSPALCTWSDAAKSWKPFWEDPEGVPLESFIPVDGHGYLAFTRGHMGSGRLFLLDEKGTILIFQDVSGPGHSLAQLTGQYGGDLLLCSGPAGSILCNLWIPDAASRSRAPEFPPDCLMPRFFEDGSPLCVDDERQQIGRLVAGDWVRDPLALEPITDLYPLDSNLILIRSANSLHEWRLSSGLRQIRTDLVLWSGTVGGRLLYSNCRLGAEGPEGCSLREVDSTGKQRELWDTGRFVPASVTELPGGAFLIDGWRGDDRQLVKLVQHGNAWMAEVVWREEVP